VKLLLLPGMDGTSRLFEPLIAALPPQLKAVTVAYPSDKSFGYEELLPIVENAVPSGPFVVVGESFSGPLAVMLSARHPPGLCGIVLCASFVQSPLKLPERLRMSVRPWIFSLQPLWILSWILLGSYSFGHLGAMARSVVRSISPAALAARTRAVLGVDVTNELRACKVPIFYLQANRDLVVRTNCWELVKSVRPDAKVEMLAGPHLILQTAPTAAAAALEAFCENVTIPYK